MATLTTETIEQRGDASHSVVVNGVANITGPIYIRSEQPTQNAKDLDPNTPECFPHLIFNQVDEWLQDIEDDRDEIPNKPPRRPVAAICCSNKSHRVFLQKDSSIYEARFEDGKLAKTEKLHVPNAKDHTQLAAVMSHMSSEKVHLFYIAAQQGATEYTVREICSPTVEDESGGWSTGLLSAKAPRVSPYSALAALSLPDSIMIFYQRGDWICQLSYAFLNRKWEFKEVTRALKGTSITVGSYATESGRKIHLYYQDQYGNICERISDILFKWYKGALPEIKGSKYTPLHAIVWCVAHRHVRLYYVSDEGHVCELSLDRNWMQTPLNLSLAASSARLVPMVPDNTTDISGVECYDGREFRLFFTPASGTISQMAFRGSKKVPTVKDVITIE
ncbi:hypothetical protein F5Y19DRAFT_480543 [Xylariaceae sp. FL1651]|nr:hypothetical protein F5Y19DRAFT_480543 [Xylariaceae sp. FL1651]